MSDLKKYVAYWNGSKTIERFMKDRGKSKQYLLLFLEYLTPVSDWMVENPTQLNGMFRKAIKSIDFLEKNGMVHFDAHIYNWLTDGRKVFLTDFGLLLDSEFELSNSERQFFHKHRHYDYAQVVETFGYALIDNHFSLHPGQKELVEKQMAQSPHENSPYLNSLISAAITLHENKKILLPAALLKYLRRFQPIINAKNVFFRDISTGKKTSTIYPVRKLGRLLRQLDVIE